MRVHIKKLPEGTKGFICGDILIQVSANTNTDKLVMVFFILCFIFCAAQFWLIHFVSHSWSVHVFSDSAQALDNHIEGSDTDIADLTVHLTGPMASVRQIFISKI